MKLSHVCACILMTGLGACVHGSVGGSADSKGGFGFGGSLRVVTSEPSEQDLAAARAAERLWPQVMVRCGESYFSFVRPGATESPRLTEYWGLTPMVRPETLSESDRQAGVAWLGYTKMKAAFKRQVLADGTWSEWQSCGDLATVPLRLVREEWDASAAESALVDAGFASPPECSAVPPRPSALPSGTW